MSKSKKLKKIVSRRTVLIFVALFALVGSYILVHSFAAGPNGSIESENGTVNSPAVTGSDANASNTHYVQFKSNNITPGACLSSGNPIFKATTANGFIDYPTRTSGNPQAEIYGGSIPNNRVIDATGTTWHENTISPDGVAVSDNVYALKPGVGTNVCFSGGSFIDTTADTAVTDWQQTHDLYGFYTQGLINPIFENLYLHGFGDEFSLHHSGSTRTDNFLIRGNLVQHSRDDCVEDDDQSSGRITDTFFDGCYNFFSSKDSSGAWDSGGRTVTIDNSLVWLEPEKPTYKHKTPEPGTSGFFKIATSDQVATGGYSDPVNINLSNLVLMARQPTTDVGLGVDDLNSGNHLKTCTNVTIIWLGSGSFPGTGWPSSCLTVVTGQAGKDLWISKVNAWYAAHPQFTQYRHSDGVYYNFCQNYTPTSSCP
ncbi:MAG: hypothetical protein ACXWLH_03250 [Candidatus Saccharimonadales bacterium]